VYATSSVAACVVSCYEISHPSRSCFRAAVERFKDSEYRTWFDWPSRGDVFVCPFISFQTPIQEMARAAVAVYEAEVDRPKEDAPSAPGE
jgi:hypothetical protein